MEKVRNLAAACSAWKIGKHTGIARILILMFALVSLYIGVGRRHDFYGEQTETQLGWDLDAGITPLEGLDGDKSIRQNFYPQDTVLNYIYIGLERRGQTGTMVVTVYDENNKRIGESRVPCAQLVDSGAQGFGFNIRVKAEKKYYYKVTFEDVTDEYPRLLTAVHIPAKQQQLGGLFIHEERQDRCLWGLFVYQSHCTQNLSWWSWIVLACVMLLYGIVYPFVPIWKNASPVPFLLLHALIGLFLMEFTAGTNLADFVKGVDKSGLFQNVELYVPGVRAIIYNLFFICCIVMLLSLVIWNGRTLLTVELLLCLVVGIAEYYVLEFRGTPITLSDLASIGTAGDVSGGYHFDLTHEMFAGAGVLIAVLVLEGKVWFR